MRIAAIATTVIAIALLVAPAPAPAGTIVFSDSGTIGGVELQNTGIVGTTATIEITRTPNTFSFVNTVNGVSITPEPASVEGPITLEVTPTGGETYNLMLVPDTYVKTVGDVPGAEAMMAFDISKGVAPTSLPNFFNMSGAVTSLLENADPTLDYSKFAAGGSINFTFTGTTFGGPINSFAGLFDTVGSSIVANGSFSQQAVPEPSTIISLGIGLSLIIPIVIRARRRTKMAA